MSKGILQVTVLEGCDFSEKTAGVYVRVCFEGTEGKTSAQKKTGTPVWKSPFEFPVASRGSVILVSAWDVRKLKSDKFLGEAYLELAQLGDLGKKQQHWVPLQPRNETDEVAGRLQLQMTFTPSQEEATKLSTSSERKAYSPLLAMLNNPGEDHSLLRAMTSKDICDGHDSDNVARYLFGILPATTDAMDWLDVLIQEEVNNAPSSDPNTLFRLNSVVTKVLKDYSRVFGGELIMTILRDPVESLRSHPERYELDPNRLGSGPEDPVAEEQARKNAQNVGRLCGSIVHNLISKLTVLCPREIHTICHFMYRCVSEKFSDVSQAVNEDDWVDVTVMDAAATAKCSIALTAVGGFFFLRFLCPAIVLPDTYFGGPTTREAQRALLTVSKVMQNMANGVQFGYKEPHMTRMNEFVSERQGEVLNLLEKLSEPPPELPPTSTSLASPLQKKMRSLRSFGSDDSNGRPCYACMVYEKVHVPPGQLALMYADTSNSVCCDCYEPLPVLDLVSLSSGAFLCQDCADLHHSLLKEYTASIVNDKLQPEDFEFLVAMGNEAVNMVYEHNEMRKMKFKPAHESSREMRPSYINKKYKQRHLVEPLEAGFNSGQALMDMAASNASPREILRLLARSDDGLASRPVDGQCALHVASEAGHHLVVYTLASNGADLNFPDSGTGKTALHFAAMGNHRAAVKTLLMAGARVDVEDTFRDSPLAAAKAAGAKECASLIHETQFEIDSLSLTLRQKDLIGIREFLEAHLREINELLGNSDLSSTLAQITASLKETFDGNLSMEAQHRVGEDDAPSIHDIRARFKLLQKSREGADKAMKKKAK